MTSGIVQLPDDYWAVLNHLTDHTSAGVKDIKRDALNVSLGRLRTILVDLSERGYAQRRSGTELWLRTNEGNKIVDARKALLDPDTLADRLKAISTSLQNILDSGLNRRAIVVLLHDSTRVNKRDIEAVLDGLNAIEKNYCK